jgi:hypothetical protein
MRSFTCVMCSWAADHQPPASATSFLMCPLLLAAAAVVLVPCLPVHQLALLAAVAGMHAAAAPVQHAARCATSATAAGV